MPEKAPAPLPLLLMAPRVANLISQLQRTAEPHLTLISGMNMKA